MVNVKDYPQLRVLQWRQEYREQLTDEEAYAMYCQHKLAIDDAKLTENEEALIYRLFEKFGSGGGFV